MLAAKNAATLEQPYPGLRSFQPDESMLFNGRARHIEELLRRLGQTRFLAVIGGSGSGKSSLVRAGLLPALHRGYLLGATSRWRVAVFRPGSSPMSELSAALAGRGALGAADETVLHESSFGLVNAVHAAGLRREESVLLVVDQFEELFRFRRESADRDEGAEASLFVSQLLQATDDFGTSIFVVITMRSDFLADCTQFPGLPEALNKGQFLIPHMTREQRQAAIVDGLGFFDASMSDRLAQRLLNDAGDDPDQLPVLQHALRQTYRIWEQHSRQGEIDLDHYIEAGTMQRALNDHAQRVYESIPQDTRWIAQRIFRCLTVSENGRAVRRPAKLGRLLRVVGVADDPLFEPAAMQIIKLFAAPENCFLLSDDLADLDANSVIDISHESLIRKWTALRDWVQEEAKGAEVFRYLRRDASLYPGEAGLWDDPDLAGAFKTKGLMGWNEAWADQYSQGPGASYEDVEKFLDLSVKERERKHRREVLLTRLKWGAAFLAIAVVVGAFRLWQVSQESKRTEQERLELIETTADLEEVKKKLEEESAAQQKRIDDLVHEVGASPRVDEKLVAELERLQSEQDQTTARLNEREKIIRENENRISKTDEDYSQSLRRINELQKQLEQAWDERDRAQNELRRLRSPEQPPIKKDSFQSKN